MRVLLDTHALLWWWFDDSRLSRRAHETIADPDTTPLVSVASAWEIATKYRLGKLPEAEQAVRRFSDLVNEGRMESLPVLDRHALRAGAYTQPHRDPFDRMLAAQSELEGVPLVTLDRAFEQFRTRTLW